MKTIKKIIAFLAISILLLVIFILIGRFFFNILWNFDILNVKSYKMLSEYWENGGVINTFKDYSFIICFLLLPICWLISSYKIYKYGFVKFLTKPIITIYKIVTQPKTMEVEHVSIKNLGSKDKTLDEIISDKIKEKGYDQKSENISRNLRKEISAKIIKN